MIGTPSNRIGTSGFKQYYSPRPLDIPELSVCGMGIREVMPPCQISRPRGTSDYLLMLFHDEAVISTDCADTKIWPAGSMMIWPPGKAQFYGHPTQRYVHTWIHCEGARIRRLIKASGLPLHTPFSVTHASLFEQCLLDVHQELVSYVRPDAVIVGNHLENGLRSITRSRASGNEGVALSPGLLAVRQLIGEAPARRITLHDLATLAGMSIPSLCVQFKKSFGLSPIECLIQHRMRHAAHLLANPLLSIQEIGRQVGYEDPFHFSKLFKKHFSYSPREARHRAGM